MDTRCAEKIFHHLHHCMNLMHRAPCDRRENGHANGHAYGKGRHRGQGRIMMMLRERDGISQRELAELLHIRPASLSELLDKLESAGMIERRQNETDRRMSQIYLTGKGQSAASEFETAREERMGALLSGLTAAEQETLSQLLEKFASGLQDQFGAGLGRGQGGRGRGKHEHGPCVCGHGHGGESHHQCQCGNPGRRGRGPGSNHPGEKGPGHHQPCGGHGRELRHGHDNVHGNHAHGGCCGGGHGNQGGGCG